MVAKAVRILLKSGNRNVWLFLDDLETLADDESRRSSAPSDSFKKVHRLLNDVAQEQRRAKGIHQHARNVSDVFRYLIKHDDLKCGEPRDKVYALIPMALRGSQVPKLVPNYDQTLIAALTDLIKDIYELTSVQYGESASSVSDLMVCLMKLVKSFGLELTHPEVQFFFMKRLDEAAEPSTRPLPNPSKPTESASTHGFQEFRGICMTDGADRFVLRSIEDLPADVATRLRAMGFGSASDGLPSKMWKTICDGSTPALITTENTQPGDILLTPFAGPMAWTWNLIFRASSTQPGRYELVGQATPVKGGDRTHLGRGRCCHDEICPARASSIRVHLHPRDVLSLALPSRAPAERLKMPTTTPDCGSFALVGHTGAAVLSVAKEGASHETSNAS